MATTLGELVEGPRPIQSGFKPKAQSEKKKPPAATPTSTLTEDQGLIDRWKQYLANPEVKRGLLQFAIMAAQPRPPGQSQLGHLTSAVASGGEAIQKERDRKGKAAELAESQRLDRERLDVQRRGQDIQTRGQDLQVEQSAQDRLSADSINRAVLAQRDRSDANALENTDRLIRARFDIFTEEQKFAVTDADRQLLQSIYTSMMKNWQTTVSTLLANALPGDPVDLPPVPTFDQMKGQFLLMKDAVDPAQEINLSEADIEALAAASFGGERSQVEALLNGAGIPPAQAAAVRARIDELVVESETIRAEAQERSLAPTVDPVIQTTDAKKATTVDLTSRQALAGAAAERGEAPLVEEPAPVDKGLDVAPVEKPEGDLSLIGAAAEEFLNDIARFPPGILGGKGKITDSFLRKAMEAINAGNIEITEMDLWRWVYRHENNSARKATEAIARAKELVK